MWSHEQGKWKKVGKIVTSIHSRRGVGKTRTRIRSQVKLERHRGVSQGFIYVSESESGSEWKSETVNEAKYSTRSGKHDVSETWELDRSVM